MDARFGARPENQRYMSMLREQVDRLSRLMQELLEYGKPPRRELAPGLGREVIEEALRPGRAPLAEQSGAHLIKDREGGPRPVRMDRDPPGPGASRTS